jgi:hypothetical protein
MRTVMLLALVTLTACLKPSAPDAEPQPAPASATAIARPSAPLRSSAVRTLPFVDEGAGDPTFAAFRSRLLDVIARGDREGLLALVDPRVRTSFDGGGGMEVVDAEWRLADPQSRTWTDLERVIGLGGAFTPDGAFWAPYVFATWPDDLEAVDWAAVITADAIVRSEAGDAPEIARLDHAFVRVPSWITDPWTPVTLQDGRTGFMRAADLRSALDYRAGFSKRSGTWLLEAFVAGD